MNQAGTSPVIEVDKNDFIGVYQKICKALAPVRIQSVSMHDVNGEPDWLSESAVGPDEHRAVLDALQNFVESPERVTDYCGLGNSRSAITLRVEDNAQEFLGAVLLVVDTPAAMRFAKDESELLKPSLQRALNEYAGMRHRAQETAQPAPQPVPPSAEAIAAFTDGPVPAEIPVEVPAEIPVEVPAEIPVEAPAEIPVEANAEVPLEVSLEAPAEVPVEAAADALDEVHVSVQAQPQAEAHSTDEQESALDQLNTALRRDPIELHVQRLVPLRPDTERRRYEVLLRSQTSLMKSTAPRTMLKTAIANGLGSMIDRRVVTELISWLTRHPAVWQVHGLTFSVNLTRTALHDANFMTFVELCLAKAALRRNTISFEIDVPTALRAKDRMPAMAAALEALGCPLILDDFVAQSECFALMQLPGISLIKVSADVTVRSRRDRIAKAALAALLQRSRAQQILAVAKRTRTRADEEWLTDLGFDFVQSNAFSQPVTISSLVKRFGSNATQA